MIKLFIFSAAEFSETAPQRLLLPGPVHNTAAVLLALLEQHLALPLVDVARVDVPARLDAETAAGAARRRTGDLGHRDVLARVELEGRLRAEHLEVDLRVWVVGADEFGKGQAARVDRDAVGGLVDDEAVVDIRLLGAQGEGLVALDLAEGFGPAGRDAAVVDGEVGVGREGDDGAFDRGGTAEVEVPSRCQSSRFKHSPRQPGENLRVVRHVDNRLIGTPNQLGLVLHRQHNHLLPLLRLLPHRVHNTRLHRPGKSLIAIGAHQAKLDALPTLDWPLNPGNLPHTHRDRPVPDLLAPPDHAAVQVVGPVVGGQGVLLAVDLVEAGAADAVGHAPDRLAKVGRVVALVLRLLGEALHDVKAADAELLDDRAEGQEGYGGVGHCGGLWVW